MTLIRVGSPGPEHDPLKCGVCKLFGNFQKTGLALDRWMWWHTLAGKHVQIATIHQTDGRDYDVAVDKR